MAVVHANNYYEGQSIKVDGISFRGNVFKNCLLVYGGGPLDFSHNTLENTHWHFIEEAGRTVALLSSFYQQGGHQKDFVEFLLSTYGQNFDEAPVETSKTTTEKAESSDENKP